jgi:arylsulfatase A-like enzyme
MDRPNIIFVFSDQQRWDTCGCYGQPLPLTPNLDCMAAAGTRFDCAFTCQPVCGPARACLQTGRYATEVGCFTNHRLLPFDTWTIAKEFNANNYETAYVGKWHLASCGEHDGADDFRTKPVPLERRGGYRDFWLAADILEFTSHSYDGHMFDTNMQRRDFPEGRYRADAQTDWVIDYLRGRSQDRPLFLFVSYIEPHHQNDHQHYEGPRGSQERFKDFVPPGDLVNAQGDWRAEYPDYLGCINNLDENIGRLRAALDELGMADNTALIYTSDHGSHFCTRNSEYKRACHDGCIRIPMIACGPGFNGGHVVEELVSLIDVPPTLLAAAGVTPPAHMRGHALQPLVAGAAGDWPDDIFLQISESQVGRAVRTARWKYSVHAPHRNGGSDPDSDVYVEEFLYDLYADPHEQFNLVTSPAHASVRAEMAARLLRRMLAAGEPEPAIFPHGHVV